MGKFYSTKTFGNDRGLSCCFRQWRATHSHCSLLHGYSLGFKLVFECDELDQRNWVYDFGGLDTFKEWLSYTFDHTLVIARDDPYLVILAELPVKVADIRILDNVGCERFAELAFNKMSEILDQARKNNTALNPTVRVKSVECFEHSANSAIFSIS
jgi:6-pyruvoyltetrahydropterin/6-carboxytetrahydropterin synthase